MTVKEVAKNTDTLKAKVPVVRIDKATSKEPEVVGSLVIDNETGKAKVVTTAELKNTPVPLRNEFGDNWARLDVPSPPPVNGDGTFTVDGKLLTPIQTGIKAMGASVSTKVGDLFIQASLPWQYGKDRLLFDELEFALYEVPDQGSSTYYFLDKQSSVNLSGHTGRRFPWRHRPSSTGILVLVNATSKNDTVIKENVLFNVISENNVLNDTSLVQTFSSQDRDQYSFQLHSPPDSLQYRESEFRTVTATNAKLPAGTYLHCNISRTTVESQGGVRFTDAHCDGSHISANNVNLRNVTVQNCQLRAEGSLAIKGGYFAQENISAGNVYITDKFSLLKVTVPHGDVQFVRSSGTEFNLSLSYITGVTLPLTADREEILKAVVGLTHGYRHSEKQPKGYDIIIDHVVDMVVSRLKVVNMLVDAKQLLNEVSPNHHSDHSRLDPYGG